MNPSPSSTIGTLLLCNLKRIRSMCVSLFLGIIRGKKSSTGWRFGDYNFGYIGQLMICVVWWSMLCCVVNACEISFCLCSCNKVSRQTEIFGYLFWKMRHLLNVYLFQDFLYDKSIKLIIDNKFLFSFEFKIRLCCCNSEQQQVSKSSKCLYVYKYICL